MLLDEDYVIRMFKRIAEAIARAIKVGTGGKPDEALVVLREACVEVLGMEFSVLSMLDVKSAVDLLGSHDRVLSFVQLVEAMGDVEAQKNPAAALQRYQHAFQLAAVLRERDGSKPQLETLLNRLLERIS